MTFIRTFDLNTANATGTAFGRQRVAGEGNRFDIEFKYNKLPLLVDEITNNGTATFVANTKDVTLALTGVADGNFAGLHSYPVPYTPGNGQETAITAVLDYAAIGGGTAEYFLRTSTSGTPVESVVAQGSWMNATSGVDWTKSHIFSVDFQSLKVGSLRLWLNQSGISVQIGQINNDNIRNSGYWQTASLPQYWRIYTTGGITYMEVGYGDLNNAVGIRYKFTANASATMKAICATVKSEGGLGLVDLAGLPFTANSGDNSVAAINADTTVVPILSMRAKSTFLTYDNLRLILPKSFTIQATNPILVEVRVNPTLTGGSWADADALESAVEYNRTATAVSGGVPIFSDYIYSFFTLNATDPLYSPRSILKDKMTGMLTGRKSGT